MAGCRVSTHDPASRLIGGEVAWGWYLSGYAKGLEHGHAAGYAQGHTDGTYAEAARKGPIPHQPDEIDRAFAYVAERKAARRASTVPTPLTPEQIRTRAAESWAVVEQQIRGAA